jgi:hypothetical protein
MISTGLRARIAMKMDEIVQLLHRLALVHPVNKLFARRNYSPGDEKSTGERKKSATPRDTDQIAIGFPKSMIFKNFELGNSKSQTTTSFFE